MKFKVGENVKIIGNSSDHGFPIGVFVHIQRVNESNKEYVCNDGINWWYLSEDELEKVTNQTNNKMQVNQLMKDAALVQAQKLFQANNTVTTLELKVELRKTDPEFFWDQATVSKLMDEFAQEGKFTYTDNGIYRVYSSTMQGVAGATGTTVIMQPVTGQTQINLPSSPVPSPKKTTKRISKTKALSLLKDTKGHFFKVVFTKQKDGKERTINCQLIKDKNGNVTSTLGIVRVKEASLMKKLKKTGDINTIPSKSVIRSFNINNLKSLAIGGETYKIN